MIFAAKESVERRAFEKGWLQARGEAIREGRLQESERILHILEQYGVELPPEVAEMIACGTNPRS